VPKRILENAFLCSFKKMSFDEFAGVGIQVIDTGVKSLLETKMNRRVLRVVLYMSSAL
jgi:hypothetical protein